jgi:hypothetical protein
VPGQCLRERGFRERSGSAGHWTLDVLRERGFRERSGSGFCMIGITLLRERGFRGLPLADRLARD